MKAITAYLIGAAILAFGGGVCFKAAQLDSVLGDALEQVVAENYDTLDKVFDSAEGYYRYAAWLPWIGDDLVNDMRARKAALQYWQRHYDALVSEQPDPLAHVLSSEIDRQFLIANGIYRQGLKQAKDRTTTLAALDAGIAAYLTVLKNATRHNDAAYNYEFLVRVREDVDKGRRKTPPSEPDGPLGRTGAPQQDPSMRDFKLYVPLESTEREKDNDGKAGKGPAIKRQG